jgi:hypothetical protein
MRALARSIRFGGPGESFLKRLAGAFRGGTVSTSPRPGFGAARRERLERQSTPPRSASRPEGLFGPGEGQFLAGPLLETEKAFLMMKTKEDGIIKPLITFN